MSFSAGWTPISMPTTIPLLLGSSRNFHLLPPAPETGESPSVEPTWHNIPFHEAFPVPSWIHLSGSKAQRRPLSPQQSPDRMLCEHKALPGLRRVLDATQRIPIILSCLLQCFTSTHRPESTRGCRGTCLVFNNSISCNK